MPADADPMDVRYNVIQWVHRSTRGWSYGESLTDPRTGEIIQGRVTLGSLARSAGLFDRRRFASRLTRRASHFAENSGDGAGASATTCRA